MQASSRIKTPAQYLTSLPAERRSALTALHRAITKAAPRLKPVIVLGMLGYGPYHYVYESGREGDSATVCLASQKNYISLYLMGSEGGVSLVQKNKARLGKISAGGCCIRFKKLEDLNLPVALELVKKAGKLRKQP
jgi:Domain of unknown function (DU1801)